jgi:DNA-directed RNA polymerase specialized sigma24 family protein
MRNRRGQTDLVKLLRAAQAGDRDALTRLLEEAYIIVTRDLRARLHDPLAAGLIADTVQEAMRRILRSLQTCRAGTNGRLVTWILRIGRRAALDSLLADPFGYAAGATDPDLCPSPPVEDFEEDGDQSRPAADIAVTMIRHALRSAPDDIHRLLYERFVCGGSWAEVADRLGTSASAAKRRWQRFAARLRSEIECGVAALPADASRRVSDYLGIAARDP